MPPSVFAWASSLDGGHVGHGLFESGVGHSSQCLKASTDQFALFDFYAQGHRTFFHLGDLQ